MLQIYNSLTKKKEVFQPIQPNKVGMYVCGMTVYDYCHIGHARVLVNFDMITRYLRARGYEVKYVRNVTDIDDKIINRANEQQEEYSHLTSRFIQAMHEDAAALGVEPPTQEPRATAYMQNMIALIEKLMANGNAYQGSNGDIFFDVSTFQNYGQLAHQDLEKLRAGARVAVTKAKDDPLDFVLWKIAKPNEPFWESPWGKGRPGWHIECSAMSMHCLGEHFDIHGGGFDLTFPHHENEIAQSEAATKKHFVNTWMHVGFVQIDSEKMSKSLGNFFTIREVLAQYDPEVVRYFLLSSHYRSPLNYSTQALQGARQALERFYLSLRGLQTVDPGKSGEEFIQRFHTVMEDDFNTPEALAVLFDLVREINKLRETNLDQAQRLATVLKQLANILGILTQNPEKFLQGIKSDETQQIEDLITARNNARKQKQWAEADKIRQQLLDRGIVLEDKVGETVWRRVD